MRPGARGNAVVRTLVAFVAAVALLGAVVLAPPAAAEVARPLAPRFAVNTTGDVLLVGNTTMTCPEAEQACVQARAGQGGARNNNNSFAMQHIDVDDDPATFASSRAQLALPGGTDVLWAGLYWGGRTNAGARGQAAPDAAERDRVLLAAPGLPPSDVTATQLDTVASAAGVYQGFAEVTQLVQAAGPGDYTVADVQSGTGEDRYGGWTLVVVTKDPAEPLRNLVVADGFAVVRSGEPATLTVDGFRTPPSGPVRTRLGAVTYEGDRGATGDRFLLEGSPVADGLNAPNNAFNSGITDLGARVTAKAPDQVNQLGFEVKRYLQDDVLPNDATATTIALDSSGDTYYPGAVTLATELFAPDVGPVKSVVDADGGDVLPGDVLTYDLELTNAGDDAAAGLVVTDVVPAGTSVVPGSLEILTGPGSGSQSDQPGDDLAEVLGGADPAVRFRLGTGASPSAGGGLAVGATTRVRFSVTVDEGLADGTVVRNAADATFTGATSGLDLSSTSNPADVEVTRADPPPPPPSPNPSPSPDPTQSPSPDPAPSPTAPTPPSPSPAPDPTTTPTPAPGPRPSPTPARTAPPEVTRLAGDSRVDTAVEVSRYAHPDGVAAVTIAREDVYADALAGAAIAARRGGPILLSASGGLSPQTAAEIERLGAGTALLLGGEAALADEVRADITALGLSGERVGGDNRFGTAALLATELGAPDETVYLAEGGAADPERGWPDPMAVAHLSAFTGRPVLLATADSLPVETRAVLDELGVSQTVVVGGADAVSGDVLDAVEDAGYDSVRLAGTTRYETSAEVFRAAVDAGMDPATVWLATGADWPDALGAGPVVGRTGATFLLVDGDDLGASVATRAVLEEVGPQVERVVLVGGDTAISPTVEDQVRTALTP